MPCLGNQSGLGTARMGLEQRRQGDPRLLGGGCERGQSLSLLVAGRARGKSCMDTWKHAGFGVRTEYWDRDLERCRELMAVPAVDGQGPEQPCLEADAQSRRLYLRPPEVPHRHIS